MTPEKKLNSLANRIGISTNLFLDEENVEELVRYLATHFPVVEVEIEGSVRAQSDEGRNLELARSLRKIAEDTGSTINIHAPYIRVDYILGREEDRAAARDTIIRSAEFAICAGAQVMTFHPGFRFPKNSAPRPAVKLWRSSRNWRMTCSMSTSTRGRTSPTAWKTQVTKGHS